MAKPLRRKDGDVRALLLVGIYQAEYLDTPAHAVVNAAVEATRLLKKNWAKALVNAVLRRACDSQRTSSEPVSEAVRYQHPQWLIDRFRKDWPADWQAVLTAGQSHPPLTLRVNRKRTTRDEYLAELNSDGENAQACKYSCAGIQLNERWAIDRIPGFSEGAVSMQDQAAQLAATLIGTAAEMRILDA